MSMRTLHQKLTKGNCSATKETIAKETVANEAEVDKGNCSATKETVAKETVAKG